MDERDGAGGPVLACQRDLFSLPEGLHYLNCAYMSPLPRPVEEAVARGLRRKRNPMDIAPRDFFEDVEEVRRRFGDVLGGDPERVAIVPSVSYGISLCARNLEVGRGQRIVVTAEQFPGNVYAWRRVAAEAGAEVVTVGPGAGDADEGSAPQGEDGRVTPGGAAGGGGAPGGSRGARWNARLLEAVTPETAVVALPHVHWTDGTLFDLEAVGRRAREFGAALVLDATQSVGALPLDLEAVRPDAVVTATYKWLLGPYSMALVWMGDRFADGVPLEETWMGREGSEDFQHLVDYRNEYQAGARRYDVGEVANFGLLPGVKEALGLIAAWRPRRIQAYCADLTAPLVETARDRGFVVEDDRWRGQHLFGIRMRPDVELDRLKAELDRRRISASLRGTALRVSPNVYNDAEDVAALQEVLDDF
ncbi:MAG: aminotransferase class V-fold PLP-dependent enzyme [Gemmatimonadota bacterium]|jgi:selenocysteine lyase/cysteine desulfurase